MASVIDQEIELTPVDSLTLHPNNPREGDVGAIAESITCHGFYGVIVAQRSTGRVLAGNHRLQAAIQTGITRVPVAWLDVSDDEAARILLVDNRTNDLASYDQQALLQLLLTFDGDLLGTGYDEDDLETLLRDVETPLNFGADVTLTLKFDTADELEKVQRFLTALVEEHGGEPPKALATHAREWLLR